MFDSVFALRYSGLRVQDQFERSLTEIVAYRQTNIWEWGWIALAQYIVLWMTFSKYVDKSAGFLNRTFVDSCASVSCSRKSVLIDVVYVARLCQESEGRETVC